MAKATDIASRWFAERMATGPLSRDAAAHAQAIAARDDLFKRLAAPKDDAADVVRTWFGEAIATGAIAGNTAAYNQAFAARDDLIGRMSAAANDIRPATRGATPKAAQPKGPAQADPEPQA